VDSKSPRTSRSKLAWRESNRFWEIALRSMMMSQRGDSVRNWMFSISINKFRKLAYAHGPVTWLVSPQVMSLMSRCHVTSTIHRRLQQNHVCSGIRQNSVTGSYGFPSRCSLGRGLGIPQSGELDLHGPGTVPGSPIDTSRRPESLI
jgi:hypothetical protein